MLAYVLLCLHRNHGKQEMPFLQTVTLHTLPFPDSAGKQTASKIHCQEWIIWLHSTMCTLKKITESQNISSQNGSAKTTKPNSWHCTRPTPRVTPRALESIAQMKVHWQEVPNCTKHTSNSMGLLFFFFFFCPWVLPISKTHGQIMLP